jgi:hypothetical protein
MGKSMASIMGAKLPVLLAEIEKIKPQTYIEIGCYQCDTMKEVAKLGVPRLIGFDLFEQAPEHEEAPLDGLPVTWEEAQTYGFELYRGNTNETLHVLKDLELTSPVAVFIDGGHSFETTLSDIEIVQKYIPNAILLMDDISMHGVTLAMKASGLPWIKVGLETARVDL